MSGNSQNPTIPPAVELRNLPEKILAVALRNDKKRFFIPSGDNTFAGIRYEYVMVDSGCNSILLPFPTNLHDLQPFGSDQFFWEICWSNRVGVINSPTLLIYCPESNDDVGELWLAGRSVVQMKALRFHLGKSSANQLLNARSLADTEKAKLREFLHDLGDRDSDERSYVRLGQSVLTQVFALQAGKLLLLAKRGYFPVVEDFRVAWRVIRNLESSGLLPNHFHDLDDADHDGDIVAAWSDDFDDENWSPASFMD